MKTKKRDLNGLDLFSYYRNIKGNTLLHEAVLTSDSNAVKFCVSKEDLIDLQNNAGETALHLCASTDNIEIAEILVESGCKIEIQNNLGWTPLMQAVLSKSYKVINYLLSLREKVEIVKKRCGRGFRKIKNKVKFRFNPFITDQRGLTVYHYAELMKDKTILEKLYTTGFKFGIFTIRNREVEENWFNGDFLNVFNRKRFRKHYQLKEDVFAFPVLQGNK